MVLSFQVAVNERNYTSSTQIIDQALRDGTLLGLVSGLEEIEKTVPHITLAQRDHIFHYLGLWDIYFAVQMPSRNVLELLEGCAVHEDAQTFMVDFIRGLVDKQDERFDQFCIDIQTISKGQYAILIPSILERRTEELLSCKIQFKDTTPRLYCTADLLETYYGRKIVTAAHGHRTFDIVVSELQYDTIRDSLASTGLDTEPMLVKIDSAQWDEYVKKRRSSRTQQLMMYDRATQSDGSSEITVLHRVSSARSNIYSSDFNVQHTALMVIYDAKTQSCNDVLTNIATTPSHSLRTRALKQLGEFGDRDTLDLFDDILKNDKSESIRTVAARAYSELASRIAGMGFISPLPATKPPVVNIAKISMILNNLVAKGMPTTMMDETLNSVVLQGGSDSSEILLHLFESPHEEIRRAIIRVTKSMDKQSAASIIRVALNDESQEIVRMAEAEIDTRWSDGVWD